MWGWPPRPSKPGRSPAPSHRKAVTSFGWPSFWVAQRFTVFGKVQRFQRCDQDLALTGALATEVLNYSPPTVSPSTRIVGAATDPRNSKSLAISEILKNNSFRFPATVISSTGYANSPPEIHIPEAPRE